MMSDHAGGSGWQRVVPDTEGMSYAEIAAATFAPQRLAVHAMLDREIDAVIQRIHAELGAVPEEVRQQALSLMFDHHERLRAKSHVDADKLIQAQVDKCTADLELEDLRASGRRTN